MAWLMTRARARSLLVAGLPLIVAASRVAGQDVPVTSSTIVDRADFAPVTAQTIFIGIGSIQNDGDGVVTSAPAGINCTITDRSRSGTCEASFPEGTTVTLTATPAGGNTFGHWVGGPCTAAPTCEVTTSVGFITVFFNPTRATLTIVGAGVGWVRIEGDPSFDFLGTPGIGCIISAGVATGGCTTQFPVNKRIALHWENQSAGVSTLTSIGPLACGPGFCSGMMPDGPLTAVATVIAPAFRIVSGAGNGQGQVVSNTIVSPIDCTVSPTGATGKCADDFGSKSLPTGGVILSTTPAPGSRFAGWSGSGGCSGTATCVFDRTEHVLVDYVATFELSTATLSVSGSGTGSGSVVSTPSGVSCSVAAGATSGTCVGTFATGTQIELEATPSAGSTFGGWSGACTGTGTCKPDLTADRAVTATFVQATVALNVTGTGTGNGVVTSSPGSLSCTVTKGAGSDTGCSAALPENAAVTLTADPQGGSTFGGWSGDACSGTTLTCTLTMSQSRGVVARFTAPRPGRDIALTMLGGGALAADEREQLDRFGNKDGVFNLGDLLALLDRTGERLTAATTVALVEAERRSNAAPTTQKRRAP